MQQRTTSSLPPQSAEHSPLLPQYAFVVQFRAGVDVQRRRLTGRVEHVTSGQAISFESLEELLQFMEHLLAA